MIFDWTCRGSSPHAAGFRGGPRDLLAGNNLLSVLQQSFSMRKNGVKVEIIDNLRRCLPEEVNRRRDRASS